MTTKYPPLPPDSQYAYIYRMYDSKGRLLYVGQTTNPYARWNTHKRQSFWVDKAEYYTAYRVPKENVYAIETATIKRDRPLYNGTSGIFSPKKWIRHFKAAQAAGSIVGSHLGVTCALKTVNYLDKKVPQCPPQSSYGKLLNVLWKVE